AAQFKLCNHCTPWGYSRQEPATWGALILWCSCCPALGGARNAVQNDRPLLPLPWRGI
ncbi:MAG: hypothetical protein AVDCRST_MAG19-1871, partial [uncultured Thermomicrobiales bacterium]